MPDIAIVGLIAGFILFFLLGLAIAIAMGKAAARGDEMCEDCREREERKREHV
jgi:hypothetical protein